MSTLLRNPSTYQNRNRMVTKAQELLGRSANRGQQRELVEQQKLILMQQLKHLRQVRQAKQEQQNPMTNTLPIAMRQPQHMTEPEDVVTPVEQTPSSTSLLSQLTIFVSIASYRDSECIHTVRDLFAKAEHPQRVFVGVYEQNDPETDKPFTLAHLIEEKSDEVPDLKQYFDAGQLRVMITSCVEAKGPMYARALIERNLFQNEDFYMIIDSHSLFEPGWDSICIREFQRAQQIAQNPKVVLSYFPLNFALGKREQTPLQLNPALKLDYLRFMKFDKNTGFPMPTEQAYKNMPREPIRALFWTAAFSFAPGSMIAEVPFDDGYPFLFLGEEICMNLRLFTWGYDVYGPSQHVLYHVKDREYRPTFWELFYSTQLPRNASFQVTEEERSARKAQHSQSIKRMSRLLLNDPQDDDDYSIPAQYGLGTVRSYADFCDFIGINFQTQQVKEHSTLGRTKHPTKEEQYAKMVEHESKAPKLMKMVQMRPMNMVTSKQDMKSMTPSQRWSRPQSNHAMQALPAQPRHPTSMTRMTGLTGGGQMFDPAKHPQKEIPRTRPQQKPQKATGPPRPRAYAQGSWGKG